MTALNAIKIFSNSNPQKMFKSIFYSYNKKTRMRLSLKLKYLLYHLLLFFFLSFIGESVSGQHLHDITHFKKPSQKTPLVLNESVLNSIGINALLDKIENVHNTLNRINATTNAGYNTHDIEENFPSIDSSIDIIAQNLTLYNTVLDVKNLQLFNVLLTDITDRLHGWRVSLFNFNKQLASMNNEMAAFKKDTILTELMTDQVFRITYAAELTDLQSDWLSAQKSTENNLEKINILQSTLSNEYFEAIDLQNNNRELLRKVGSKSLGKEYNYLWEAGDRSVTERKQEKDLSKKSYEGQKRILGYYFLRNWDDQVWVLLTGLLIFIWIVTIFNKFEKYKEKDKTVVFENKFIKKIPILATLVVLFNLAPLFDIHPPTFYVEIMQFMLVVALTILMWRRWPAELFKLWLAIGILYIIFSFTAILLTPVLSLRVFLLIINIVSVFFGLHWLKTIKKYTYAFAGMITIVSVIYIVLNAASAIFNIFGRLSLAKILSVTAIFGLTQIVGLSVFIQIIMEAFQLQTLINQLKGGITARFNFERIQKLLRRFLMILSIYIWTIVFTINLNIYNLLFRVTVGFLNKPRKIGSTSFEIGNILLFILIIYVSNLLQQGIGSLYGKTDDNWDPQIRKNGSRLAMTRLVLIIVGFLVAIAASGLPLDKITIVLGALGVGIGLGLQSIVNNLVSGVILIFEQPFRIGDYIELADKRGRVMDIGIRSSKLVMEEGAEVILPNGDLLSGRVINWTLRDDNVRIELPITIEQGRSFQEVEQIIMDVLNNSEYIWKNAQSEILLIAITDKLMSVHVLAWINNVHRVQFIRSDLLSKINLDLAKHEIKMI